MTSRHNLPAELATFIGREREVEEIRSTLQRVRLPTLMRRGGAGKTRLALRAASGLISTFPDGVWLERVSAQWDVVLVRLQRFVELEGTDIAGGSTAC